MINIGSKIDINKEIPYFKNGEIGSISINSLKGKWLCFVFYPRDFTFVCPTELSQLKELENEFYKEGCEVFACSTDSEWSHKAWFEQDERIKGAKYYVLADASHYLSRYFGVLDEETGAAQRASFIVDADMKVRWINVSDGNVGRSIKEMLRAFKALKTGSLCPAEWEPGQETIKL